MINPTVFGKFILLERVSVGGMAEVFRAKLLNAPEIETLFAIKRILPHLAEDEEFVSMFINEAQVAISLLHPNVCQIHELGHLGKQHYIAMEYIAGRDIQAIQSYYRRQRKIMSISQACFIIAQAAQGLDYAHRAVDADGQPLGIVHRDVSPQNLVVTYDGFVKLIDFGVAKAFRKVVTHSKSGVVKGKFSYMSPEQAADGAVDHRSDIFALGIVFWEMLTGRRLFQSESEFAILEMIQNGTVEKPSKYNRMVPEAVDRICMKALEKDPANRYNWASEMVVDLFDFINSCNVPFTQWHLQNWMSSVFESELNLEKERIEIFKSINTESDIKRYVEENAAKIKAEAEDELKRAEEEKKNEESLKVGSSLIERVSEDDPTEGPGSISSISMARRKPGESSKSLPGVKSISLGEDSLKEASSRLSISRTDLKAESDDDIELEPEGVAPTVSDPTLLQIKLAKRSVKIGRILMVMIIAICGLCVCSPLFILTGVIKVPEEKTDLPTSATLELSILPELDSAELALYNFPFDGVSAPIFQSSGYKAQIKDLNAGTYVLSVEASGFEKEWFSITVENGSQDATVELTREIAEMTTYTVNIEPEDASVYVNKQLHPERGSSLTINALEGSAYEVKGFKIGYEPQVFTGTVSKDMKPLNISLTQETPVHVTVSSVPSHYHVYTYEPKKKKMVRRGETPMTFSNVNTNEPMKIEIHKGKHVLWSNTIDFSEQDSNDIRVFADIEGDSQNR